MRVVRCASARSRCCPRATLVATPAPHSSSSHPAALRTNVPHSPHSPHPREHGALAHPRARDTSLPCPAPRRPRTRTPERRARASLTTSPAASPRVRGLGVSPRALGAALLLVLAPRTPRARPPREREESVQGPALRRLRSRSARAPPRTCTPSARLRVAHRIPVSKSPRARIAHRLPAPEYGDTMSPRVRSPHRPRRVAPQTCNPVRAQGVAVAPSSSHLHPPNAARGRGREALASYPARRPRASFARSLGVTGMTRAASLREYALVHRRARNAAQCRRPRPRAFPLGLRHPRLGRRRGRERGVKTTAPARGDRLHQCRRRRVFNFGGWRSMVSGRED
ncbi:hypothetical protein DFH09DRAFT_1446305 [Mycena vulgaris]|nr:hypothetical protein DFH09DRAFT_1446305 [Mycena vulgaris]